MDYIDSQDLKTYNQFILYRISTLAKVSTAFNFLYVILLEFSMIEEVEFVKAWLAETIEILTAKKKP